MIRLLVVDDSALTRRLISGVFAAQSDFEVAVARDGAEALQVLHEFAPDVVTLDIHMPVMDGLACLDRIMIERPCPVIMVASPTVAGADAALQAMELGAIDFIAKPDGAITLATDVFAPLLLEKVRAASKIRPKAARRLTERVRFRLNIGDRRNARARPHSSTATSRSRGPFDGVVLVGSSTGGPPALEALLSPLPGNFPWPVIVAQHMPLTFTGPLSRRLDKLCELKVIEVTGPMPLVAGHVYVGRGDSDIVVMPRMGGVVVTVVPADPEERWHPSVNRLVTTAIEQLGAERLVGVLMTGMGNDGAAAMARLSAEGGRTIAEAQETAVVWGMPGELVKIGGAQAIVPLSEIASQLMAWTP